MKNEKWIVLWLTWLPASGKTTLSVKLAEYLNALEIKNQLLDGDDIRKWLNNNLWFSKEDRKENIRRIAEVAKLMNKNVSVTIVGVISPFKEDREMAKAIIWKENFTEIYINTSIEECVRRDPKGLYKKAISWEIKEFTWISSPYDIPLNPELVIQTEIETIDQSISKLTDLLVKKNIIDGSWHKHNYWNKEIISNWIQKAIFIWRFQPYHYWHIKLIEQKMNTGIPILIFVRDIEPDQKNPFTAKQTANMIKKYHKSKGENVEVKIIPDIESINYWRGVWYEVNHYFPPKDIMNISATYIRESIKNKNNNWRKMVDESIQEDVIKYIKNDIKKQN